MSSQEKAIYAGIDNLDIMKLAVNYNNKLIAGIKKICNKNDLILDFGAGNGLYAKLLESNGYKVICVEPDTILNENLKKNGIPTYKSLDELNPNTFQVIYSLNVLEHIEDDESTIRNLFKYMDKNGYLYIYVPAFPLLYSSMDKKVGHVRRYLKKELSDKLTANGFQVRKAKYSDFCGFLATLVYKLLSNQDGTLNKSALIFYDRFIFPLNKILDPIFGLLAGKNLEIIATKHKDM